MQIVRLQTARAAFWLRASARNRRPLGGFEAVLAGWRKQAVELPPADCKNEGVTYATVYLTLGPNQAGLI